MKQKLLVTGGAGFIGSHLVDRLIKEGYQVSVIDNLSTGNKKNVNPKAHFYKIDICSPKVVGVFKKEKPLVVFHLASQINLRKSVVDPVEDAMVNILGSLNILQNFLYYSKVKPEKLKFIFVSTGGALYGETKIRPTPETYPARPLSPYGCAKLAVENYLNYYQKVFNLPVTILRLANVYGPRQNPKSEAGVIAIFCEQMIKNKKIIIYGDGKQTRDFIYVEDVVNALIAALNSKNIGVYNIGTEKETNINTLFKKIKKFTNSKIQPIYKPVRQGEQKRSCLNCSLARKKLKWQPKYDLDKGLEETINWFRL
ncbi:MAG TPA: GDP-mannose 4,6-dehydratase [Candidatus Paceibacterota bacterium]|nr:GDP-mannose 4,6-dehydratase [Candidatus Paceibacterota bacterium]